MNWRSRLTLLCILAIPAFSGYPLGYFQETIVPGLTLGWIAYALMVHGAAFGLLGPSSYRLALIISLLITLPVVLLGSAISLIALFIRDWTTAGLNVIASHYAALAVTMLTVIPLALAIVAAIPFHRMENRLLNQAGGVSLFQKSALMFTRVCIHVIYFVIPEILEVLREERILNRIMSRQASPGAPKLSLQVRASILVRNMIQVGVEGICSSVRHIPLWAEEIARLPGRESQASTEQNHRNNPD